MVLPPSQPTVVPLASDVSFGNGPPPYQTTVTLPRGRWAKVVLTITGTETGRQYDRLLQIWAGHTPIFLGVTPEPTPAGITWVVTKDVTDYLPALTGTQTFTIAVDNYLSSIDTGIPQISARLAFYPGGPGPNDRDHPRGPGRGHEPPSPPVAPPHIGPIGQMPPPGTILPLSSTATGMTPIGAGQTLSFTVQDPTDVTAAMLHLYIIGQANDRFGGPISRLFGKSRSPSTAIPPA